MNRRNPITFFKIPNTVSTVDLRSAYKARPLGVRNHHFMTATDTVSVSFGRGVARRALQGLIKGATPRASQCATLSVLK